MLFGTSVTLGSAGGSDGIVGKEISKLSSLTPVSFITTCSEPVFPSFSSKASETSPVFFLL